MSWKPKLVRKTPSQRIEEKIEKVEEQLSECPKEFEIVYRGKLMILRMLQRRALRKEEQVAQ